MQSSIASDCVNSLLVELAQAKELTVLLEAHFANTSATEFCKKLTPKILSSIEKSIHMAKSYNPDREQLQKQHVYPIIGSGEFPNSVSNSSRSENSDQAFIDHKNPKRMCKKRKTLQKWTNQVRLGAGVGAIEGPIDDGYNWRKYGQKDILGAKYPRGYYRCTHRNSQGCNATKQVQRSDEDPQVFDITYHGTHTCLNRKQSNGTLAQIDSQQQQQQLSYYEDNNQQYDCQNQDLLLSFETGLQVKAEDLSYDAAQNALSFTFGSSSISGIVRDNFFSAPSTPDNSVIRTCQTFVSPATSESTYFAAPPCRMDSLELGYKLQTSEADLAELISPNSSFNCTMLDVDFMFDLDANFHFDQFDNSSLFS